jgi:hypothetical protein
MRSKIVRVFGERYYKVIDDMSIEELILDRVKTKEELECCVADQISKTMPEDRPQW